MCTHTHTHTACSVWWTSVYPPFKLCSHVVPGSCLNNAAPAMWSCLDLLSTLLSLLPTLTVNFSQPWLPLDSVLFLGRYPDSPRAEVQVPTRCCVCARSSIIIFLTWHFSHNPYFSGFNITCTSWHWRMSHPNKSFTVNWPLEGISCVLPFSYSIPLDAVNDVCWHLRWTRSPGPPLLLASPRKALVSPPSLPNLSRIPSTYLALSCYRKPSLLGSCTMLISLLCPSCFRDTSTTVINSILLVGGKNSQNCT